MILKYKHHQWQFNNQLAYGLFLACWLLLNLAQAWFTQLHYDEAYYWLYSKQIAWGYFDHPPMVALLIKLGYSVFHNELGVRLLFVFMGTATLWLIILLLDEIENIIFLFFFIISIPLVHFHACGFLALPDTPLVFFATLFFVVYRIFLKNITYKNAIILGIVGAAMLYSKYHGILIIMFTILSNLKLLKNIKTWVVAFTILILMIPHLWWQYVNEFPTITYQFVERFEAIRFVQPFNFMLGQLFIPGILTGVIMLYFLFTYKSENDFERTLKWNIYCFYIFFILFSFRTNTQAHWTAAVIPPLIYISFKAINQRKSEVIKWFKPLAIFGIICMLVARVIIANDGFANFFHINTGFNNWKTFTASVDSIAKGREVVFVCSYRRPAVYSFYTGKFPLMAPRIDYRYSQFDLVSNDDSINHKDAVLIGTYKKSNSSFISDYASNFHYENIPDFISYHKLKLNYKYKNIVARPCDIVKFEVSIQNTSNQDTFYFNKPGLPLHLGYNVAGDTLPNAGLPFSIFCNKDFITPMEQIKGNIEVQMPEDKGEYYMRFFVMYNDRYRCTSGKSIKLIIR